MSRRRIAAAVLVASALSACSSDAPVESKSPAALLSPSGPVPVASIVDGSVPGGVKGFYFRPPIAKAKPAGTGEFDGSILDLLAVDVCEWNGTACVALVRHLTAKSSASEQLRVVEGAGYYQAVWNTASDRLDPSKTYRIRVLASGGELGHADVEVVNNAAEVAKSADAVRLVNGSVLPIGFRVEKGVGQRAGTAGGTINLAGGNVTLTLPPGALPNDIFLTVVPATNLPSGGPNPIPGTAWDFGPDGLVFDKPVTMTIKYDPANLPQGTDESELRIHKLVNGSYVQVDAGSVDVVNHTLSAPVNGFSIYVGLTRRFPGSQQDLVGPAVPAIEVFDPSSGTYQSALAIDASSADVSVRTRITMTDNISGVGGGQAYFIYMGPSGKSRRFICWFFGAALAPTSGSDTNGQWECTSNWPRYTEAGAWTLRFAHIEDKVGNNVNYLQTARGLCENATATARCITNPAQVNVTSNPNDTTEPTLVSLDVSPPTTPRTYGPSVSVDLSTVGRLVMFRFHATDDLAGVGTPQPLHDEYFEWQLRGPSGQTLDFFFAPTCTLLQGNALDGFWECGLFMPRQAEVGTWTVSLFLMPDVTGNGGRSFRSVFTPNGSGQLCNVRGNCITPPTVQVTGAGDAEPPQLLSLSGSAIGTTVTLSATITDNLSGANFLQFDLSSVAAPGQIQRCFATLSTGTPTNGTWTCTLTFSQFSALGQWTIGVFLRDVAGNVRSYFRRPADGFLCYVPVGGGSAVCQSFQDTDIIIN
jgi:hypothetical protein